MPQSSSLLNSLRGRSGREVTTTPVKDFLYKFDTGRTAIRLLFVSTDETLLNQSTQSLDGYLALGDVFDEVHILILRTGIKARNPVLRVGQNVWLYTATAENWWWTPITGASLVDELLQFADGFRPDLIVARDPFESGLLAYVLGQRYDRVIQVHILEDFMDSRFSQKDNARWRRWLAKFVLKRVDSVRTATQQIENSVRLKFPTIVDVGTLPRFNNFKGLANAPVLVDVTMLYPQYHFRYLFVGELSYESTLPDVLEAVRMPLQNQSVGLIVMGDGPARNEFVRRAKLLGLEKQVVFVRDTSDLISYIKTADAVLVTDQTAEADEVLLKAAAIGKPIVVTETEFRADLFTTEESALVVPTEEPSLLYTYVNQLLNDQSVRYQLSHAVQAVVAERLHDNIDIYRQSFKQSIESALLKPPISTVKLE